MEVRRYEECLRRLPRINDIAAECQRITHTLPPGDEGKGVFGDIRLSNNWKD